MEQSFWSKVDSLVQTHQRKTGEDLRKVVETIDRNVVAVKASSTMEVITENHHGFEILVERPQNHESELAPLRTKKQATEKKIEQLTSWKVHAVAFAEKLAEHGVVAQAILPRKMFNALCKQFGIYRFEHIKDGKTSIASLEELNFFTTMIEAYFIPLPIFILASIASALTTEMDVLALAFVGAWFVTTGTFFTCVEFMDAWKWKKWVRYVVPWSGFLTSAISLGLAVEKSAIMLSAYPYEWFGGTTVGIGIGSAVLFFIFSLLFYYGFPLSSEEKNAWWGRTVDKITAKLCAQQFSIMSHAQRLKRLFPNMVDGSDGEKISVRFPRAPHDFIGALLKLEKSKYKPMIAATPDAITIDRNEAKGAIEAHVKEMLSKPEPVLYCAKKYVDGTELVAAISSFGEFPNEQEMLQWAETEGVRLCFN